MAATQTNASSTTAPANPTVARNEKKKLRRAGKKKLALKLREDKEFSKTYFGAKAKRAADKKSTFRKKKNRKKA